jgi:ABC-type transport system involved in multi-copper enzyme maturation permease subunit
MSVLHAISPFGPIFGKELRITARKRRNYALRVAYLGGLLMFLMIAYLSTRNSYGTGASARVQRQAMLGYQFFATFTMFSVIVMGAIGPILTCTAVSGERLHKTMHVLLMTPITSWQIASGKLFSRLLTAFTLIGLSLPVLALVRLLGGVEVQQMAAAVLIALATAAFSASIGLLFSTFVNRAYAAILLSYAAMLILYMFVPFVVMVYMNTPGTRGTAPWMSILATSNPFMCAGMLAAGQTRTLMGYGFGWPGCVALHFVMTGVLLVISSLLIRRTSRHEGEKGAAVGSPAPEPMSAVLGVLEPGAALGNGKDMPAETGTPAVAVAPIPAPAKKRKTRVARVVSDNPVLWHEIRRPLMPKRWQAIVGAILCVLLMLITYWALDDGNDLADEDTHMGYAFIFHGLMTLLVCVLAGTAIAQEKESDTWTLLLTTPVSGAAVVWGKVLGVLRRAMWPLALIVAHFFVFMFAGIVEPYAVFSAIWVVVTFNLVWVATGVYLSLRIGKVTFAVILNLLLPILIYVVAPLMLTMLDLALDSNGDLAELVLWYLPFFYQATLMDDGATIYAPSLNEQIEWWTMAKVMIAMGLIHVAAFAGIVWYMIARFNAIVGRAPQIESMSNAHKHYRPGGFPAIAAR